MSSVRVAVVTDSTACLSAADAAKDGLTLVPLHVVVDGRGRVPAREITPGEVADILARGKERVSTSRPSPGEFVAAYREVAERTGVTQIVSVHLSAQVSGTVEAAQMARDELVGELDVHVVDSKVLAMGLAYAAHAAASSAAAGGSAEEVVATALAQAQASRTWFYVDTLEHLRRGGRIGTAAALLGSALAIKPLLELKDGQVHAAERVRTRSKALARLIERAVDGIAAAGQDDREVLVAVHELGARETAEDVAAKLLERTGRQAEIVVLDPVVGVHTGPGTVGIVVAPRVG